MVAALYAVSTEYDATRGVIVLNAGPASGDNEAVQRQLIKVGFAERAAAGACHVTLG